MNEPQASQPFKTLGTHLRYLREQSRLSLSEVSGAVEIDVATLERIERGTERPAEDVLLLLIGYFDMQDQEAVQLWELAGYEGGPDGIKSNSDLNTATKQIVMLLATDLRTVYTDGLDITANPAGITMNFSQSAGPSQAMPVARVGMSYEQATNVLNSLQYTLLRAKYAAEPKALPAQTSQASTKSKKPRR